MRLISQLLESTSSAFQKIFKYMDGTATSKSFVLPVIFTLNDLESVIASSIICLSWLVSVILPYRIKLNICNTTGRPFALSIWLLLIALMQSVNGEHLLNITPLPLSPNHLFTSVASAVLVYIMANCYCSFNRYVDITIIT